MIFETYTVTVKVGDNNKVYSDQIYGTNLDIYTDEYTPTEGMEVTWMYNGFTKDEYVQWHGALIVDMDVEIVGTENAKSRSGRMNAASSPNAAKEMIPAKNPEEDSDEE